MSDIVNVNHELTVLRSGIFLKVFISPGRTYSLIANNAGFQIERDQERIPYVDFTSFPTPDNVSEDEKDLIEMLTPMFDNNDREMIELGELMVVHYEAGTSEEEIDTAVRKFTKVFERG